MSQLALYLLGAPRLELLRPDGDEAEAVRISRTKVMALLAHLAVTAQPPECRRVSVGASPGRLGYAALSRTGSRTMHSGLNCCLVKARVHRKRCIYMRSVGWTFCLQRDFDEAGKPIAVEQAAIAAYLYRGAHRLTKPLVRGFPVGTAWGTTWGHVAIQPHQT